MELFGPKIIEKAKSLPRKELKSAPDLSRFVDWRQAARSVKFPSVINNAESQPTIRPEDRALLTTPFPLHHQKNIVICAHCQRPLLSQIYQQHIVSCTRAPARRTSLHGTQASGTVSDATPYATSDISGDDEPSSYTATTSKAAASRKRKNESLQAQKPKRQKSKVSKPKPVFNIDKQCGVLNTSGQPCARSLTCKAHSMGSKRAVQGRSQPFDTLLLLYQRSNLVKQASISTKEAAEHDVTDPKDEELTPDQELSQVMNGIANTHRAPLDRKVMLPTRSRTQLRVREMLSLAMLPHELNASGDAIFGRSLAFCSQPPYTLQFVRAPAQRFQAQRALMRRKQEAQAQAQSQSQKRSG